MAYYSGSANDMAAVRSALVAACVAEGWAWDSSGEILSKGVLFVQLQVSAGALMLQGRTSAGAGNTPYKAKIGVLAGFALTYPLAYEIFVFNEEIFMVVNYSVDCYQWCAFGKSTVNSLPGTGMWVGASGGEASTNISMTPIGGGAYFEVAPALFWGTYTTPGASGARNCWVHSNLDGLNWAMGSSADLAPPGIAPSAPLMGLLPSNWNSEAVLLPLRAFKYRPDNKISIIADLEHARHTRVDNYSPGEVITIGHDRWKVYPWFRKNIAARNGGNPITHTGTFGWAIRYEGP